MKETALTRIHRAAGARMVEYAGYSMPVEYSGVINEHLNVRKNAGLFDVSHMGVFWVKGNAALNLLQYVVSNDLSVVPIGRAQYSCLPNGKGGIVDDLIIYHYDQNKYMLVVNAANTEKDWQWLNQHNTFGADLEDNSGHTALIALQGPKAKAILQPLVKSDLSVLKSFSLLTERIDGMGEIIIASTGYTGAGGYELTCKNGIAVPLWSTLLESGDKFGLLPVGLAARDTLRLEMGYCLYGNDIDDTTSPIEAGLGWIVKPEKRSDFIDSKLIKEQIKNGVQRKLIGFELNERGIPRKDYLLFDMHKEQIGKVTSGTMSPSLQKGIGMGYVKLSNSSPGSEILVQVRDKYLKAEVVKLPFIKNQMFHG
jgi:aminomethyltransferase